MKRQALAFALLLALGACRDGGTSNNAAPTPTAAKAAGKETIAKALESGGDTRFLAAVRVGGLGPTFAGPGPYTVLVPDNAAFAKLPAGAMDKLTAKEGKPKLVKLLTLHVLPGTMLAPDIAKAIDAHGGKALLITMAGETLTATKSGDAIVLTDPSGGTAKMTGNDDERSNGVVHHIDTVLRPKA